MDEGEDAMPCEVIDHNVIIRASLFFCHEICDLLNYECEMIVMLFGD